MRKAPIEALKGQVERLEKCAVLELAGVTHQQLLQAIERSQNEILAAQKQPAVGQLPCLLVVRLPLVPCQKAFGGEIYLEAENIFDRLKTPAGAYVLIDVEEGERTQHRFPYDCVNGWFKKHGRTALTAAEGQLLAIVAGTLDRRSIICAGSGYSLSGQGDDLDRFCALLCRVVLQHHPAKTGYSFRLTYGWMHVRSRGRNQSGNGGPMFKKSEIAVGIPSCAARIPLDLTA